MNNFFRRSITAIVYAAVFIASAFAGIWYFAAFLLLLNILGLLEFYRITGKGDYNPQAVTGLIGGIYLFSVIFLVQNRGFEPGYFLPLLPFFILVFITEIYKGHSKPFHNIALTFLGILYISLPLALFPGIATVFNFYDPLLVISVLILIWTNDTGAYLVGSRIGTSPLTPISPKKTIEGTAGGAIAAILVSLILSLLLKNGLGTWQFIFVGLLAVAGATYGDLVESMLKRSLGLKDSGTILPGHGGILDRIDALLLALPLIYTFLYMIR